MINKLGKRFEELEDDIIKVIENCYVSNSITYVNNDEFIEWRVKARNLLLKSCGENSEHYKEFLKYEQTSIYKTNFSVSKDLLPVLRAAKSDFQGGYLSSIKVLVQAEIFESELEQAEELLKLGYKTAAAVVAGIVLETSLRELCDIHGIGHGRLDKMNADLTKAGVYGRLEQKQITALADIRNSAAHGNPDNFKDEDVTRMIQDIERFLINNLR